MLFVKFLFWDDVGVVVFSFNVVVLMFIFLDVVLILYFVVVVNIICIGKVFVGGRVIELNICDIF